MLTNISIGFTQPKKKTEEKNHGDAICVCHSSELRQLSAFLDFRFVLLSTSLLFLTNRLYSMCFVWIVLKTREWERSKSKGDPNIRVWGVVISNRTDFSVVVATAAFCLILWIRQNTTNPRSGHYNKLNGLCDIHPKQ